MRLHMRRLLLCVPSLRVPYDLLLSIDYMPHTRLFTERFIVHNRSRLLQRQHFSAPLTISRIKSKNPTNKQGREAVVLPPLFFLVMFDDFFLLFLLTTVIRFSLVSLDCFKQQQNSRGQVWRFTSTFGVLHRRYKRARHERDGSWLLPRGVLRIVHFVQPITLHL